MGMFDKLNQPEQEAQPEVTDVAVLANAFAVKTDEDYTKATDFIKRIKNTIKDINDKWKPLVESAYETHKKLKAQQNEAVKPLEAAELYLRGQMTDFMAKKEKARLEAERKIREAQEDERRRQQIEADRIRKEQEAEQRKAQEEADKLAAAGKAEEAAAAREQARINEAKQQQEYQERMSLAAAMPAASVQNSIPKEDGISWTTELAVEIVDDALVPITINGKMLRPVDMAEVKRQAKAGVVIPGIKVTEKKVPRVRA
jgi:hypothetical protein